MTVRSKVVLLTWLLTLGWMFLGAVALPAQVETRVTLTAPEVIDYDADLAWIRVADLDGDSVPEVLLGELPLVGSNSAIFQAQLDCDGWSPLDEIVDGASTALTEADFNADGFVDLIVARADPSLVEVYLGSAGGQFLLSDSITSAPIASLAASDLDGDSVPDVVATNGADDSLSVFYGSAGGTLDPPVVVSVGDAPTRVIAVDLDGDGYRDLIASCLLSHDLAVVLSDGLGGFLPTQFLTTGLRPTEIDTADLDLDGAPDVIVIEENSERVSIYFGDGTGGFDGVATYATPGTPNGLAVSTEPITAVWVTTLEGVLFGVRVVDRVLHELEGGRIAEACLGLASGDVDGDGDEDLIAFGPAGRLTWVHSDQGEMPGAWDWLLEPGTLSVVDGIRVGDLDGDGRDDMVWIDPSFNALRVRRAAGSAIESFEYPFPPTLALESLLVGDFDGDGTNDVFVRRFTTSWESGFFRGTPAGPLQSPVWSVSTQSTPPYLTGDFDADGHLDLLSANASSDVFVGLGNGDGTFEEVTYPSPFSLFPRAVLDVNGDGRDDLVGPGNIGMGSGLLIALAPTFSSTIFVETVSLSGTQFEVGDLNNDGLPDLVMSKVGELRSYLGNGNGLDPSTLHEGCPYGTLIDLDGDGFLDWVGNSPTATEPKGLVLVGLGDGTFRTGPNPYFDTSNDANTFVVAGRFDDTDQDSIAVRTSEGHVLIYRNRTLGGDGDCDADGRPDHCEISADPDLDLNGDGLIDDCTRFLRGDANGDGQFDLADVVRMLEHLFLVATVGCRAALDTDANEVVDLGDAITALSTLFGGGAPLPPPYPQCGTPPIPSPLDCSAPRLCP